jgi:hypothetical protein
VEVSYIFSWGWEFFWLGNMGLGWFLGFPALGFA